MRRALTPIKPGALVLVACSGGPDSLALAAATAFAAPKLGLLVGAITVDHGVQPGSSAQADRVSATLGDLTIDPIYQVAVEVAERGSGYRGPEAAARQARYAAFEQTLASCGAAAILLGHTMDDQAETVLLGLARGSGARSIAGMAASTGCYLRPLLGLRRRDTVAACAALGLRPWHDPQNSDQAYRRTRVRDRILPLMEELIGPGVTESLARTAELVRADAELLDALAGQHASELFGEWPNQADRPRSIAVTALADLPGPIRTRLLKLGAVSASVPAGSLTARHVRELDLLITDWHGQGRVDLPGGVSCQRRYGRLHFTQR